MDDWGILTFSMHGEAGDWVLIYQPLPGSPTTLNSQYAYNVTTHPTGDDYAVAFLKPIILHDTSGKQFREGVSLIEMPGSEAFHPDFVGSSSAFTNVGVLAGVAMFFGATAPWDLNLTYVIDESGPILVRPFPHGSGMTFEKSESVPVAGGGLVRRADLDTTIDAPGWTILQIDRAYPEPVGIAAHTYDVTFPNGYVHNHAGATVGTYNIPVPLASGVTRVYDYNAIGAQTDTAGLFHASIRSAGQASSLVLRLVHFPMEPGDFPADLNPGNYAY